jgi:hypothetical protein
MLNYTLGTIEASEALIKDLYIDLRAKVNAWSKITQQTPQARMGYVGQHLVSVVTGYPGGKSGARGYDLVIDDERHGEIKTCYRVDQLGSCNACGAVVSSLETECAVCGSTSINRKDDSKWLIAIRNNDEFAKLLDPYRYYFVLFNVIKKYSPSARVNGLNKEKLLQLLEDIRKTNNITNADLCNKFADEIYLPKIVLKKADIPLSLRSQFIDLR